MGEKLVSVTSKKERKKKREKGRGKREREKEEKKKENRLLQVTLCLCLHPLRQVEVLTPSTCENDLIWKQGFFADVIKLR